PSKTRTEPLEARKQVRVFVDGEWRDAPLYDRERLVAGDTIDGTAVVVEANATTVVEPGWRARMTPLGDIVLERHVPRPRRSAVCTAADPVMLEIFTNLFMSIAEQMGY